jgi:hypothetical protein
VTGPRGPVTRQAPGSGLVVVELQDLGRHDGEGPHHPHVLVLQQMAGT